MLDLHFAAEQRREPPLERSAQLRGHCGDPLRSARRAMAPRCTSLGPS